MWEAVAEYADGTSVKRLFAYNGDDNREQYEIESWLIARHPGCTYYSVVYVDE